MPTESSLVSNTSSLSAPPARECLRRIEPTSKWTATTGMSFSCAPAASHSQNKACTISHGKHLQTQRLKHTVTSGTVCARTLAPLERSLERFVERFERFERFASGVTSNGNHSQPQAMFG